MLIHQITLSLLLITVFSVYAGDKNSSENSLFDSPTHAFDWTTLIDWPSSPESSKTTPNDHDQQQNKANYKVQEFKDKGNKKDDTLKKLRKRVINRRYKEKLQNDPVRLEQYKAYEKIKQQERRDEKKRKIEQLPEPERSIELKKQKEEKSLKNKRYRIKKAEEKAARLGVNYEPIKKIFKLSEKEREKGRLKSQRQRLRKKERERQQSMQTSSSGIHSSSQMDKK